ncbi:MAG: STAS domain-containing protein [Streptosporangiaceae bacterium]
MTLPERVDEFNAGLIGEQLLSIVESDVLVLVLDMTATTACDHAGGDALARVYQRAMASGTELRLVVTDEGVRRVLTVSGIGHLVPVYATVDVALATTRPGDNIAATAGPGPDAAFVGELTGRLAGVTGILEESAGQACANLAGQLHRALGELDAAIRDVHAAVAPRGLEADE